MKRRSTYLGFGLVAVSALVAVAFFLAGQTQPTSAAGGGPEMRLTANGCAADCTFANDEKFTLTVEIVEGPTGGYTAAQSFIAYGPDLIYDSSVLSAADEILWPDCESVIAVRAETGPMLVNHGCLTGLIPPLPVSSFTGTFVEISLTCSAASSTTEIQLLPLDEDDPVAFTSGAAFVEADGLTQVVPKVSNLSVTCGEAPPADTATPTNTPAPPATNTPCPGDVCPTETPLPPTSTPAPATDTPTPTPVPEFQCGDVDRDGSVSVLDVLWVLWFDAGLIDFILPLKDNDQDSVLDLIADIDGDGVVNSIDAALILQIEAGLYSCA